MDFKNSIIVTDDKNKKILIPMNCILGIMQITERNYNSEKINNEYPKVNFTVLTVSPKFMLDNSLVDDSEYKNHYFGQSKSFDLRVKENFEVVCGLLKGSKAAEVLFNE